MENFAYKNFIHNNPYKYKTMKQIILLALTVLMMAGCTEKSTQPIELHDMSTYIVDSCEYVGRHLSGQSGILAHKGNCKFCAERRKQELEALVKQIKTQKGE